MTGRPILFVWGLLLAASCSEVPPKSNEKPLATAVSTVDTVILNADSDIVEAQRQPVVGDTAPAAHQYR